MLELAKQAMQHAHAPYSSFQVGCCMRSGDDYFTGCNVENAAFAVSICAEVAAIAQMVSQHGKRHIDEVIIVASNQQPCPPCGACRQAISEFGAETTRIHLSDGKQLIHSFTLAELLPHRFGSATFVN